MPPMYDFPGEQTALHTSFFHPEYQYWEYHWQKIRDSVWGDIQIKLKGELYLPKMKEMEPEEYKAYLNRAVWFNMTQRTLTGMMGSLFRRNAIIENMPQKLNTSSISKNGQTLGQFVKEAARELLTMGRYGVLLDMDAKGLRPPYLAGYVAENITDWTVEIIEGRFTVTEVIVRELRLARPLYNPISLTPAGQSIPKTKRAQAGVFSQDTTVTRAARRWLASYRVLRLEPEDDIVPTDPDAPVKRVYRQYYHTSDKGDASPEGTPYSKITPTWRGKPFDFIPFVFLGPYDNTPDIDKPPVWDIVELNHSHYQSYAQLEHGRYYTALPVYYSQVKEGEENAAYTVGPSVVWEVEAGCKPGIIEYNGSGLKFLENACNMKEDQIAALGGRLVGVERVSAGESTNKLKMQENNEASLLLNIANVLDVSFTSILRWWAQWQDVSAEDAGKINFITNKDFLMDKPGAREFRAIQLMYEAGVIPLAVLHDYFKRAELIPDWLTLEQLGQMLDDPTQFPNMADVQARQRGAPSAAVEWESEHVLVDPQVVAVRGYDSQAPAGQAPLPGQTQGPPVTAAVSMPGGKGVPPPAPTAPGGEPPVPDGAGGKPPTVKRPRKVKTPTGSGNDGGGAPADDVGNATPGQPATGHAHAQDIGAGQLADPALLSTTTTI